MNRITKDIEKQLRGSTLTDDERAYLHALVDARPSPREAGYEPSLPAAYIREVLIALIDERFERLKSTASGT